MKKLFTSLLLLGAVTATQAQVTVTDYDETEGTVTINFTYDGARPTKQKVGEVIRNAFGPQGYNLGPEERKKNVKTVVLTGDWNNVDTDKSIDTNQSIAEIVKEFSKEGYGVTLDLSACEGFVSKYVDVRDYYGSADPRHPNETIGKTAWSEGLVSDRLETDFTFLPVPQAGGWQEKEFTSTVTVTPNQSSVVTVKTVGHLDWAGGDEITITTNPDGTLSWSPDPLPQDCQYVFYENGKYYAYKNQYEIKELQNVVTSYTFVVNGNEMEVPADDVANLREVEGVLYYDYTLYEYEDENGSVATASTTTPHELTSDGNGGYTYIYTKTVEVEPVCLFKINKTYDNLEGIIYPVSDNFTFIPSADNQLGTGLKDLTTLKRVVLSDKIVAIGNRAFGASGLEEINFPASLQEIGWAAFKRTNITEAKLDVCTNMTRIRFETFEECHNLTTATFPVNLIEIQKEAFAEADLGDVDLSECHNLRMLGGICFNENKNLQNVTLCSHAKTIRGKNEYTTDDSEGAFHLCNAIKKVEVVGCEGTCVTECVCENRAFEWDITHYQTAAPSTIMENVALLIFPEDLPVCDQSPYSSSWDFFVGDYKNGVMITQENLLAYYRHVPNDGTSNHAKVNEYDENGNKIGEHFETVTCMYQTGNGWHEFIRVGRGEIIKVGEFLRTYSRSIGDGPCQLPTEITAYRAVDYKSTKTGWVQDKKNGTHYYDAENEEYVEITSDTNPSLYANGNRYSQLTIGGTLYLRPLVAKLAQYPGITGGYTEENKAQFDSEEVYSKLTAVPGGHSYVPENTGVVLYSTRINEEAFLMLPGDFGTDVVYKEFPHTGDRYEAARRVGGEGVNTDDDINMLHGSYDTGWKVAPVYPWVYANETENTCSGGHYSTTEPKEYRNFACKKLTTVNDKNVYGWQRLQPSMMKVNRAFAQIPVNRFDNHNEGVDQMPDFTIEDMPVENPSTNLMLINIFEDEYENGAVVDGIKTVNTVDVKVDNNAWYTIQGVRLAKQPTTVGVYIHNGKKVVIK